MLSRRTVRLITAPAVRSGMSFMVPKKLPIKPIHKRTFFSGIPKQDRLRAAILLGGPILTCCLGIWQVKRLFWKLDLIERLKTSLNQDPLQIHLLGDDIDLQEQFDRLPEYRRVKIRGRFDHSREIYIRPRPMVDRFGKPAGGAGAMVVTPFILSSSTYPHNIRGTWILVNRGWVDYAHMQPSTRPAGQVQDEVEIVAVVRKSESKISPFIQKDITDPKKVVWSQRNIEAMSNVLGTVRFYVDADAKSTFSGGPIGGQTILTVRNQHLSYIFTWFGLTIGGAYIWFRTFIRAPP